MTHIFLLSDVLIVTRRLSNEEVDIAHNAGNDYMYSLVFPPLALKHVQFRQLMPERESLGEFFLLVAIRNTDCMHLKTDSKEVKAMWLEKTSARQQFLPLQSTPNYPLPAPGKPTVLKSMNSTPPSPPIQIRGTQPAAISSDHNRDTIFDMYTNRGPDSWEKDKAPSRDTIFGMYADDTEGEPVPAVPTNGSAPSNPGSGTGAAVTHEFIKPAVSHMLESIDISSPVESPTKDNFFELPKMDKLTLHDSFDNLSTSPPSTAASSVQYGRRSNEPESPLPTSPGVQISSSASSSAPVSQSVTNAYIPPPTVHNMELAVSEVSHKPLLSQTVEVDRIVTPIPMQAALHNGPPMAPPANLTSSKSAPTTHLGPQQRLPPVPSPEPLFMNSAPSNGALLMDGGPAGMPSPLMRPRPPPNFGGPSYRPPPGHMGHATPPYATSPSPGPMYSSRPPPPPGMMARPPFPPIQRPMGQPPYPMNPPASSKSMGHRPPPLAMQPRPGMPPLPRPMMHDMRPQDPALRRSPTNGPPGFQAGVSPPGMPLQENYSFLNVPHNASPLGSVS